MRFTPIAPTGLNNIFPKELEIKAEKVCFESKELTGGYSGILLNEIKQLLRVINCYYSNKIESEGTHPINIEKALNKEFKDDSKEKELQFLALAYIETQKYLEDLQGDYLGFDVELIKEAHNSI